MKCSNKRGCEWVGTVGTLKEHVATCGYTLVPCPKQCKDDAVMRKDLEKHLQNDCQNRDHECKFCGEKGTYATITEVHDKTCDMKIVPCPDVGCGKTMQRQKIKEHVFTKCPHTVIPCKYKGIGCDTELKREDMAAHEQDDKHHLHMALDTVNLQEAKLQRLNILKHNQIFVLPDYKKKKETNTIFQFPSFYTHPNGYHMALRVYANGHGDGKSTHVTVFVEILKGKYDAELEWPFTGKVTFTLLNQLEDKNHHTHTMTLTAEYNTRIGSKWGKNLIQQSILTRSAKTHYFRGDPLYFRNQKSANTQYLKDDTLYFRLSVEEANLKPWLVN